MNYLSQCSLATVDGLSPHGSGHVFRSLRPCHAMPGVTQQRSLTLCKMTRDADWPITPCRGGKAMPIQSGNHRESFFMIESGASRSPLRAVHNRVALALHETLSYTNSWRGQVLRGSGDRGQARSYLSSCDPSASWNPNDILTPSSVRFDRCVCACALENGHPRF
jgi:hypothetical protein